ncbi:MAG TPA: hypothetical protein VK112_05730 [Fodinibius sp.]|nr:hypothetical protein [Fodinibius sp.]
MKRIGYSGILLLLLLTARAQAQIKVGEKGRLSGTVFGDYYWFAQSHNEERTNSNGFWFRRIYFTYDHSISEQLSARLRLEMSSSGDFVTETELTPEVKDAYLKWTKGDHQILAGISSTPTWGLVEDIWEYRSVEKSPLDLFDFGSSRDFGLSFKGTLDPKDKVGYHFFLGNGNGGKTELNKGKKLMFSLSYWLTDHLVIEGYADWNDTTGDPEAIDYYTLQGFAGYRSEKVNLGTLYAFQQYNASAEATKGLDIVSLFGTYAFSEKLKAYARADMMLDPNPRGESISYLPMSSTAEATFVTGGIDIAIHEAVRLQPNVEMVFYDETDSGQHPDADIVPRITLAYTF